MEIDSAYICRNSFLALKKPRALLTNLARFKCIFGWQAKSKDKNRLTSNVSFRHLSRCLKASSYEPGFRDLAFLLNPL